MLQHKLEVCLQNIRHLVLCALQERQQQHVCFDDGGLALPKVLLDVLQIGVITSDHLFQLLQCDALVRRHRHVDEFLGHYQSVRDTAQALRLLDAKLGVRHPEAERLVLHLVRARVLVALGEIACGHNERQQDPKPNQPQQHQGRRLFVCIEKERWHRHANVHRLRAIGVAIFFIILTCRLIRERLVRLHQLIKVLSCLGIGILVWMVHTRELAVLPLDLLLRRVRPQLHDGIGVKGGQLLLSCLDVKQQQHDGHPQ
mmetsp:Transcript_16852/g.30048  ORF Transcript_16852/g.30048 Transcript_16852/m.30048 type:complete len:257 (-) Transcript_16852:359-1129(-)